MQRNSFIKMTKLPNVTGRIYYISSPARQENLYAVYETTNRDFWRELAKCNQEEFSKSGTEGKCIEARELIIALPEIFVEYEPKALLKLFTEHFKQHYDTECIAALHHNKRKTNYHIHLIFSERKLLDEPIEKIATRNMFYDEAGKHVRTKKEIIGEDGEIRIGCKVIPKGEVYERKLFAVKDRRFKSEGFLDEAKRSYTDLINLYVKDDKQKLKVFDRNGVYLPMKKIGKNNPKAEQIEADNQMRTKWNLTVDSALVSGVSQEQIMAVKKTQISQPASKGIRQNGSHPELFAQLIKIAVAALEILIRKVLDMVSVKAEDNQKDIQMVPDKPVRESPKQSQLAAKYPKMSEIYHRLFNQSIRINEEKQHITELKEQLSEAKGILKLKKRKLLQEEIDQAETKLDKMEQQIPAIVKQYHYRDTKAFMDEYKASKREYEAYQNAMQEYKRELHNGAPRGGIKDKLKQAKVEVKKREADRQYTSVKTKDRDVR